MGPLFGQMALTRLSSARLSTGRARFVLRVRRRPKPGSRDGRLRRAQRRELGELPLGGRRAHRIEPVTSGLQTQPITRRQLTVTDRIGMTEPKPASTPDVTRHRSTGVRSHRARTVAVQEGNGPGDRTLSKPEALPPSRLLYRGICTHSRASPPLAPGSLTSSGVLWPIGQPRG